MILLGLLGLDRCWCRLAMEVAENHNEPIRSSADFALPKGNRHQHLSSSYDI